MSTRKHCRKRPSHFAGATLIAALSGSLAHAQTTERVSVGTGGTESFYGGFDPSITPDGRFVAFRSPSHNLVPGDTNNNDDVFVHDRQTATTERVSLATGGAEGSFRSGEPSISADARFVAFISFSNFDAADTNAAYDAYVRDRLSGTTELVSVDLSGAAGNSNSWWISISADGQVMAFQSEASNLVGSDTNGSGDIFVRDRQSGTTERVSIATGGAQATAGSDLPSISADGRFVVFESSAPNLTTGDTNGQKDIFLRDRSIFTTVRVSLATSGAQGNAASSFPAISANGRFVAFISDASNLVPGDTNGVADVFVRDRMNGTTERVSLAADGSQANFISGHTPSLSADGRFVAFASLALNLVPGDTNGWDVFLRDRQLGTTELMSVSTSGAQANGLTQDSALSGDGRYVAFSSLASNLVVDTNGAYDVFVRDRGPAPPTGTPFCFGDGTGVACPCGTGAVGNGCPNSVNPQGGNLRASGAASVSGDTLLLSGATMPDSGALYLQGAAQVPGGGVIFGDGLRCVGGAIVRLGTKTNFAGASQYPGVTDPPVSVRGQVTQPGVRTYQVWYRNAAAFCTPATFNLTNGVEIDWML